MYLLLQLSLIIHEAHKNGSAARTCQGVMKRRDLLMNLHLGAQIRLKLWIFYIQFRVASSCGLGAEAPGTTQVTCMAGNIVKKVIMILSRSDVQYVYLVMTLMPSIAFIFLLTILQHLASAVRAARLCLLIDYIFSKQ